MFGEANQPELAAVQQGGLKVIGADSCGLLVEEIAGLKVVDKSSFYCTKVLDKISQHSNVGRTHPAKLFTQRIDNRVGFFKVFLLGIISRLDQPFQM